MAHHKPAGVGKDFSSNPISLSGAHLLATIPANLARAGYEIQNNDAADLAWIAFCDNAGANPTIFAIASPGVAKGQGGEFNMLSMPHSGVILIYGANTTTSVAAREW